MSQDDLAEVLSVTRQTISQWEQINGDRPSFDNLVLLVTVLQVSWNDLMDGEIENQKIHNPDFERFSGIVRALEIFAERADELTSHIGSPKGGNGNE